MMIFIFISNLSLFYDTHTSLFHNQHILKCLFSDIQRYQTKKDQEQLLDHTFGNIQFFKPVVH